jgi:hypothetical protein
MHVKTYSASLLGALLFVLSPRSAYAAPIPPGFPDLAGYAAVDASEYMFWTHGHQFMEFYPPSKHYECSVDITGSSGGHPLAPRCSGDIPGADDAPAEEPITSGCSQAQIIPGTPPNPVGSIGRYNSTCEPFSGRHFDRPEEELPAGHKITIGPITCAQGEGDNTACLDARGGGHGFVISPERSWTF